MRNDRMEVDIRKHAQIRADVRVGLLALKVQARQIWGDDRLFLPGVVTRLMVGVGDLARLVRDGKPGSRPGVSHEELVVAIAAYERELKKELGNVLFSIVRWIDDLGLDVLECLDLAVEAQEKFANSGRPR